jgi:hypothetical protein
VPKEKKIVANESRTAETVSSVQWVSIIAGAIAASAVAFVLHGFGAAIGISLSSTAPTWRDASIALVLLSGLYLVLVALVSYGFGAYLAARLRISRPGAVEDAEFHDGVHGLVVWSLATLLTGLIGLATIEGSTRLLAPSANATTATSVSGESLIAYDLDRLFRSERRPQGPEGNIDYVRSQASRILFTAPGHNGMQADDRNYLIALVSATTGLAAPEARGRVDEVISRSSQTITRARHTAVIMGFMLSAAALLGAIAAWYASCTGGRVRDGREQLTGPWHWRDAAS